MILLISSFIAGILTVFAPCILPILPVVLTRSLDGQVSKIRTWRILGSLSVSILIFTLLLRGASRLIPVTDQRLALVSGLIIIGFGVQSLFPKFWATISQRLGITKASNQLSGKGLRQDNWWGDILIGASLGPIFTSCSPTYTILVATVLPESWLKGLSYILIYLFGLVLILSLLVKFGQKFVTKVDNLSGERSRFRRGVALIFILLGIAIATGWIKELEIWLIDNNPLIEWITSFEINLTS
ncbi:hypothetical protein KA531_01175 [Candidatus Saccharibacteria bacterium]|nr:hypothetical protein [Candidatus Saccharibacteria bacterium]